MSKFKLFLFSIILTALFLITTMENAYASYIDNSENSSLPDFILKWTEYASNGNATELQRLRYEFLKHQEIRQERISETNGAILDPQMNTKGQIEAADWNQYTYLQTVEGYSQPTIVNGTNTIGYVDSPYEIEGLSDGNAAHYEATDWNWNPRIGGEGIVWGYLESPIYGYVSDIYVTAKTDQSSCPPWYNYLIIQVSYDGYSNWIPVGYIEVHNSDFEDIYVTSAYENYLAISITTWCPTDWNPPEKSSVYVDSVLVGWTV